MQLWMYGTCGASDAEIRVGVAAADAFFDNRAVDAEQAYAGVLASAWDTAEM